MEANRRQGAAGGQKALLEAGVQPALVTGQRKEECSEWGKV